MSGLSEALTRFSKARQEALDAIASCTDIVTLEDTAKEYYPSDVEAAILVLRRLVDIQPENANAWLKLADVHYRLGDNVEAYSCTIRALESDPNNLQGLEFRVRLSYDRGDKEAALHNLLSHYPENQSAQQQLLRIDETPSRGHYWPPGQHPPDRQCQAVD